MGYDGHPARIARWKEVGEDTLSTRNGDDPGYPGFTNADQGAITLRHSGAPLPSKRVLIPIRAWGPISVSCGRARTL